MSRFMHYQWPPPFIHNDLPTPGSRPFSWVESLGDSILSFVTICHWKMRARIPSWIKLMSKLPNFLHEFPAILSRYAASLERKCPSVHRRLLPTYSEALGFCSLYNVAVKDDRSSRVLACLAIDRMRVRNCPHALIYPIHFPTERHLLLLMSVHVLTGTWSGSSCHFPPRPPRFPQGLSLSRLSISLSLFFHVLPSISRGSSSTPWGPIFSQRS